MPDKLCIGTRRSALALVQANWVKKCLEEKYPGINISLAEIITKGDRIKDVPLGKIGGKGLFIKEIEEALIKKEIDMAVHSLKDVPTILLPSLKLAAYTPRENPFDALISKNNLMLEELPEGAKIGTSSLRRGAQILNFRPDFKIIPLRGNLDTRIKKLQTEALDGIIVAAAGVIRMGWADKICQYISPEIILPAIGQGSLGIEIREEDQKLHELLNFLNHRDTFFAVTGERSFLKKLQGGCQVPVASYGQLRNGNLLLKGMVASLDGRTVYRSEKVGLPEEAENMGSELGEILLEMGGKQILGDIEQF
ncbi:MAG: hydroxymethylbilane synthase [Thermodesulfobacteriota bacterium]|nr:hydroxymethylbilane synthase [Thermodesulfobacteriota bacterium]